MLKYNVEKEGNFLYYYPERIVPSETTYLKTIGGRLLTKRNVWKLPALYHVGQKLVSRYGNSLKMSEDASRVINFTHYDPDPELIDSIEINPKWNELKPFQKEASKFMLGNTLPGFLLGLSVGLGKTVCSLIVADTFNFGKVLFVCPKSLTGNWQREIMAWVGRSADITHQEPPTSDWVITNYDTISRKYKDYARVKWDLIVCDESVLLKNRKTMRTAAIKALHKEAGGKMWLLSGSPITKHFDDLWGQLNSVFPEGFSSYWRFAEEFCTLERDAWSTHIVDSPANSEIRTKLKDVMYIKNRREVIDLPGMVVEDYDAPMLPEQERVYADLMVEFTAELGNGEELSAPNKIARLVRLQQVVSNLANVGGPDISAKSELLCDLIRSGNIEFPALIWVHWRPTGIHLFNRIKKICSASLAIGGSDVDHEIQSYLKGRSEVLILSLGVGRFGHNLVNTKNVVYHDKSWDADAYNQSLGRVQRIGLKHEFMVTTLRAEGTVDDLVEDNLAGKAPPISAVTNADLKEMLRTLGRKY